MNSNLVKILLVYLLYLAVTPCMDDYSAGVCKAIGIEHIEDEHSDEHEDSCSPLCNCLCCNTIILHSGNFEMNRSLSNIYFVSDYHSKLIPVSLKTSSPPPKV